MAHSSSLRQFPYLASGLEGVSGVEGKAAILFFNTVKVVKFIRLLARDMNGGGGYLSVSLPR